MPVKVATAPTLVKTATAFDNRYVRTTPKLAFQQRCPRRAVFMNLDTLSTLQSFLDRQTLLACMCTCSDLYASGVRFLLQFDITLRSDSAVSSFHAFVNRDRHTRLYLVRKFSLDFFETTVSFNLVRNLLMDVLTHSPRLEKLRLDGCTSSLGDDCGVVAKITTLQHLRDLHILISKDTAPTLLSDLQAPVEKLDIHVLDDLGDPWEAMPMVTRFSSSLEELCLSALVTLTSIRSAAVFPKMRKLLLNGAYFRHIGPLIAAFPNLDELFVAYAHLQPNEVEEARAANQSAQGNARWRHLDDLSGVLRALYVAAVTSDVNRMSIQLVDCLESDVQRLNAVLQTTRPRTLHLDFLLRLVHSLPSLIPPSKRLTDLRLSINMAACTADMTSDAIFDGLCSLIRPQTKLEQLSLHLFCPEWSTAERAAYDDRILPFNGMQLEKLASSLSHAAPSLRHITLDIEPNATLLSSDGATTLPSSRLTWSVDQTESKSADFEPVSRVRSPVRLW